LARLLTTYFPVAVEWCVRYEQSRRKTMLTDIVDIDEARRE